MASYDLTQTIYLFNFLSNAASNVTGNAQQLADFLEKAVDQGGEWTDPASVDEPMNLTVNGFLANMGGDLINKDWGLVWGPGVFQNPTTKDNVEADNAMFVVHSPLTKTYVVAIAGTNPNSFFDWIVEDGQVKQDEMAAFPVSTTAPPAKEDTKPGTIQVSLGTATGVYNLLTGLVDSSGQPIRLTDFLISKNIEPGSQIIFTGHSLGGALSSTLALQLAQDLKSDLSSCTFLALPTAGPSPGNAAFAQSWGDTFTVTQPYDVHPGNQISKLNQLVFSTQDLVPHAWDFIYTENGVDNPDVYPNPQTPFFFYNWSEDVSARCQLDLLVGAYVAGLMGVVKDASNRGNNAGMARLPNSIGVDGVYPTIYLEDQDWAKLTPPKLGYLEKKPFMDALAAIHVWQYHQFFGIDPQVITRPIVPSIDAKLAPAPA